MGTAIHTLLRKTVFNTLVGAPFWKVVVPLSLACETLLIFVLCEFYWVSSLNTQFSSIFILSICFPNTLSVLLGSPLWRLSKLTRCTIAKHVMWSSQASRRLLRPHPPSHAPLQPHRPLSLTLNLSLPSLPTPCSSFRTRCSKEPASWQDPQSWGSLRKTQLVFCCPTAPFSRLPKDWSLTPGPLRSRAKSTRDSGSLRKQWWVVHPLTLRLISSVEKYFRLPSWWITITVKSFIRAEQINIGMHLFSKRFNGCILVKDKISARIGGFCLDGSQV